MRSHSASRRGLRSLGSVVLLGAMSVAFVPAAPPAVAAMSDPGAPAATALPAIATGGSHTCALLAAGVVQCWGLNSSGQLGNNTLTTPQKTPTPVTGLSGVTAIAAGGNHACALLADGTVKCWGANASGQLGNNTLTTPQKTPTAVTGLAGVTAITAGASHTCALLGGGTVKCWGLNSSGHLGNNSLVNSKVPVAVSSLAGVTAITAGNSHSCALLAAGTAKCWGANT